jgi:DNA polymerase-3 subunit beta
MTTATKERKSKRAIGTTMNREDLLSALASVTQAASGGRNKPILGNVLLHDGWLTATDLEIRIDCRIDWDREPLLLPYQRLNAILREVKDELIELLPDRSSCMVKVDRGEWRLPVENAAEFPLWEPSGLKPMPILPSDQFARAAGSVVYAVDEKSSRYALGSVCFEVSREKGECWLVATDGRRLSVAAMKLPGTRDVDDAALLVPERAMKVINEIAKGYGKEGSGVDFMASSREIVATFKNHRVVARLVEGRFPRWADVLPVGRETGVHKIEIDRLLYATRAAAIVTTEQSKGVVFNFRDSKLTLTARSHDLGESEVVVDVESFGHAGTLKLDPGFVQDVLRALKALDGEPTVRVSIDGPGDAVVLTYGEDDEYKSVIMPLAKD